MGQLELVMTFLAALGEPLINRNIALLLQGKEICIPLYPKVLPN